MGVPHTIMGLSPKAEAGIFFYAMLLVIALIGQPLYHWKNRILGIGNARQRYRRSRR